MEDNQYFFSNEEGSNDSNVNMIGGMNVAPTGGMPPEGPTKTINSLFSITISTPRTAIAPLG